VLKIAIFGARMRRELVLCIRSAVCDRIQTAQSVDVARLLSTKASFLENQFRERQKSSLKDGSRLRSDRSPCVVRPVATSSFLVAAFRCACPLRDLRLARVGSYRQRTPEIGQ